MLPDFPVGKAHISWQTLPVHINFQSDFGSVLPAKDTSQTFEENLQHERLIKTDSEKEFSGVRDNGESRRKKM